MWNVRWDKFDFRNWKYRSMVTTKKSFSPLRVVNQASPEAYFFEKWKFAILVLEAWDHHQMNSHEVGTWIYVPHLISAMFGFCTNLHWNLQKYGSVTSKICKFDPSDMRLLPLIFAWGWYLDLCATLDICDDCFFLQICKFAVTKPNLCKFQCKFVQKPNIADMKCGT